MIDMSFLLSHFPSWKIGARKWIFGGRAGKPARLVAMARRPNRSLAFQAIRTAIAAELKRLYFNLLGEPIPDRMAELLKQLDQPLKDGQNTDNSQHQ
jgi:hypothetical protein